VHVCQVPERRLLGLNQEGFLIVLPSAPQVPLRFDVYHGDHVLLEAPHSVLKVPLMVYFEVECAKVSKSFRFIMAFPDLCPARKRCIVVILIELKLNLRDELGVLDRVHQQCQVGALLLALLAVNVYEEVHFEDLRNFADPGLLSQIVLCQVRLLDDGVVGKAEYIIEGVEDEESEAEEDEDSQQAASQRGVI
jgi:hypothetical protein